ncbi:MAG: hypothetical protein M0Q88_00325 [Bacilli bacterium]|nr:hypothetical protein [Bacilli bacterium]
MNIVEAFRKKLSISEKVYEKEHGGRPLSESKKIAIARVLANTSEYITEAFENSVGTQFANMKSFKKFCLDLTTVALPSLIANDLVIVYPMKSRTGYIQYLQFKAGSNKGGVNQGDLFNDPFRLGDMNESRQNYTAAHVVEAVGALETTITPAWTPVVGGKVIGIKAADGEEVELTLTSGSVTVAAGLYSKIKYQYDNVVIPQNDVPQLTASLEGIELAAKARRVGIYYSQLAAFQAKTEMGVDLGEILATQACAELSYEIDTEVVNLLVTNANASHADMTWNKRLPIGVSKRDHYAGFAEIIELGSQHIYDATKKHAANYMIASSSLKPILTLMDGWKAASSAKINGPYFAGELNGIKVYISPAVAAGTFVLGYNGGDMLTSAAVYAPYMAIVPTQLLGFSDGAMSQGFSTLYDLKMLNPYLLVKGTVVDEALDPIVFDLPESGE